MTMQVYQKSYIMKVNLKNMEEIQMSVICLTCRCSGCKNVVVFKTGFMFVNRDLVRIGYCAR